MSKEPHENMKNKDDLPSPDEVRRAKEADANRKYWLRDRGEAWRSASKEEYIKAERDAGFHSKGGGGGIATGSFNSSRVVTEGRTTDGNNPETYDQMDPEFAAAMRKHAEQGQ